MLRASVLQFRKTAPLQMRASFLLLAKRTAAAATPRKKADPQSTSTSSSRTRKKPAAEMKDSNHAPRPSPRAKRVATQTTAKPASGKKKVNMSSEESHASDEVAPTPAPQMRTKKDTSQNDRVEAADVPCGKDARQPLPGKREAPVAVAAAPVDPPPAGALFSFPAEQYFLTRAKKPDTNRGDTNRGKWKYGLKRDV